VDHAAPVSRAISAEGRSATIRRRLLELGHNSIGTLEWGSTLARLLRYVVIQVSRNPVVSTYPREQPLRRAKIGLTRRTKSINDRSLSILIRSWLEPLSDAKVCLLSACNTFALGVENVSCEAKRQKGLPCQASLEINYRSNTNFARLCHYRSTKVWH
jgi:hypothetical protein